MTDPIPAFVAELVLGDPDDAAVPALLALREQADRPPPEPSPALAALLDGAAPAGRGFRRPARIAAGVFLAGSASLALSGVAAAHDALPGPARDVVTTIVDDLTPFDIRPHQRPRPIQPTRVRPRPIHADTATSAPSTPVGPTAEPVGGSGPRTDRHRHDGGSRPSEDLASSAPRSGGSSESRSGGSGDSGSGGSGDSGSSGSGGHGSDGSGSGHGDS
jgi:uncharacterized membrane protein YgcG